MLRFAVRADEVVDFRVDADDFLTYGKESPSVCSSTVQEKGRGAYR